MSKSVVRRIIAAIIICACSGIAGAQLPTATQLGERVDAVATKMLSRPVAGISVAVARDGQLVLARGYGLANLEHSVAVTPETVFHIASISKNILAAVVLQLVDEGRLQLDDDVTKYVPGAPTRGHHVTVRQLLNHTSGIYSFTSLPEAADNERRELSHEQVLGLIKDKQFDKKLNFRIPERRREGVLLRQAANVYAINENTDVHFVMSDGGASWSMVYGGGLFLDAKYRAH